MSTSPYEISHDFALRADKHFNFFLSFSLNLPFTGITMFLQENLIKIFKLLVNLQRIGGVTNFLFTPENNGNFVLGTCSPKMLVWIKIKLSLFLIFMLIIWIQLIQGTQKFPLVVIFEGLVYCAFTVVFALVRWAYIQHQDAAVELFRFIFQFERSHLISKNLQIKF